MKLELIFWSNSRITYFSAEKDIETKRGVNMFGLFGEKIDCPSCSTGINSSKVQVSRNHSIVVYTCPNCKADFVKNKRSELFPVLEEGVILC